MTSVPNNARREQVDRDAPLLELRHSGDARIVGRALARVIVRRELISMGILNDPDRCDDTRLAG